MNGNWADVREAGVVAVAEAFGLKYMNPGKPRKGLSPCPACGAKDRTTEHHPDRQRGPIGLTRDGGGWCCHVCGVKGDAVTLAAYLTGQQGQVNREVAEACRRKGLLHDDSTPRQPRPRPPPRVPEYPSSNELRQFVSMLVPIDHPDAGDVRAWLMSRHLDPSRVSKLRIAKALPTKTLGPSWAQCRGQPWSRVGYRLIAPLYGPDGRLRSFHARAVVQGLDPKGANPAGYEIGGLLLACPLAQLWLRGDKEATEQVRHTGLVICEGMVDWLFQQISQNGNRKILATVGILSGSWRQEHADKVPSKTRVIIATDHDKAGSEYAEKIGKTLLNRVGMRRWKPQESGGLMCQPQKT